MAVQFLQPFAAEPSVAAPVGLPPQLISKSPLPGAVDASAPATLIGVESAPASDIEFIWPEIGQLCLGSALLLGLASAVVFGLPIWFDSEQVGLVLIACGLLATMASAAVPIVRLFTGSWDFRRRAAASAAVTLGASAALVATLLAISL